MTNEEKQEWVNLKITSETFRKTPEERLALCNAKKKHKEFIKLNQSYTGVK